MSEAGQKCDADAVIQEIASRRHGIVTRAELLSAGVPLHVIEYRQRRRRLERVHEAVYRVGPVHSPLEREAAALAACGGHASLSFESAGALWGFPLGGAPPAFVSVTVARGQPHALRGVRVHRARLEDDERTTCDGLSVTRPARTLFDLGSVFTVHDLERCVAGALREAQVTEPELRQALARHARRPGAGSLRRVLGLGGGPALTRSEAERQFLAAIREARLPLPLMNARLLRYEVDALWSAQKLVVEIDGHAFHCDVPAFNRDRQRDGDLVAAGYRVIRVTWQQLTRENVPMIARIARALGER